MTVSMSASVPDRSVAASLFESQLRRQLEVLAETEGPLLHQPVVGVQQADAGSHLRLRGIRHTSFTTPLIKSVRVDRVDI